MEKEKVNICIGITSYLPDNENIRNIRTKRLADLLQKCNSHFHFDILIIAQNWKDLKFDYNNLNIDYYDEPLGITQARIKLREKFLNSNYDYIIMTDDDSELSSNQFDYDSYLDIILKTNKDFYWIKNYYIRLCCISKNGFKKIEFDSSIIPERGLGWEDVVFNKKCRTFLSNYEILGSRLISPSRTQYCEDKYSTWSNLNSDLQKLNSRATLLARRSFNDKTLRH